MISKVSFGVKSSGKCLSDTTVDAYYCSAHLKRSISTLSDSSLIAKNMISSLGGALEKSNIKEDRIKGDCYYATT
jgi:hypothetical protein